MGRLGFRPETVRVKSKYWLFNLMYKLTMLFFLLSVRFVQADHAYPLSVLQKPRFMRPVEVSGKIQGDHGLTKVVFYKKKTLLLTTLPVLFIELLIFFFLLD